MAVITFNNLNPPDEIGCVNAEYSVSVDCGPDDLIEWRTVIAPGGAGTGNDAIFTNPNGATTGVIFPAQGTYALYVVCRTPV